MKTFAFIDYRKPSLAEKNAALRKGVELIHVGFFKASTVTPADIDEYFDGVVVSHASAAMRLCEVYDIGVFRYAHREGGLNQQDTNTTWLEVLELDIFDRKPKPALGEEGGLEARRESILKMEGLMLELMNEPIDSCVGDFFIWDSRTLRNKGFPLLNGPALVVMISKSRVRHTPNSAGAPDFRKSLGLVFGYVDETSAKYYEYHADARRFKYVDEGSAKHKYYEYHVDARRFKKWLPPGGADARKNKEKTRMVKSMCGVHMYEHTHDSGDKSWRVNVANSSMTTKYRCVADVWFAAEVKWLTMGVVGEK